MGYNILMIRMLKLCGMPGVTACISVLLSLTLAGRLEAQKAPVHITVQCDTPGIKVSPNLYGVFFEEINHSGDGGLYAELVRNRDFEEAEKNGAIPGWTIAVRGTASVKASLDTQNPLSAANPHSLRLDMTGGKTGTAVLTNEGYWGIAAKHRRECRFTLSMRRSVDAPSQIMVGLESRAGNVYAQQEVKGIGTDWKSFSGALTPSADDPDARLVITSEATGSLWLDEVSLFPTNTWKRRRNGLRSDLAGSVNSLKPAFVRFPGGCYVEGGDKLADAFRWKDTVGVIAKRPGHFNGTWGYRSTDGLGYHEYLQWCEDMKATPLFVVNCGLSHKEAVPLDALEPWVQDALDAIEYANGPVTSKWGAFRAANGHPKQFHLRYIEIGNENGMFNGFGGTLQQYSERYIRFYTAIKAKYPDIRTIANTRIAQSMEVVDDHYYNSPEWFWNNTHLYDKASRNGPNVYVGEYAVTQNCGQGNLRAALGEAAFLVGLERNSDVVEMASYAPLFVNVNDRVWNPNAIVFNGAKSYGTPSYHVQQIYANNRPDTILPVTCPEMPLMGGKGGIGLGTWATQSEYKDIVVTQGSRTLYSSDFALGSGDWKSVRGVWNVVDGALRQTDGGEDRRIMLTNAALKDASHYSLRLKARKLSGDEGFLIMFQAQDEGSYYWLNIGGWRNTEHAIEKAMGGGKITLGSHVPGSIETGRWYDIRVETVGTHILAYIDDKKVLDVEDAGIPTLAADAGFVDKNGDIILKVVNGADLAQSAVIDLPGSSELEDTATAITLTGSAMDEENSFAAPTKIAPVLRRLNGISSHFRYTFPPRSVTVLRLKRHSNANLVSVGGF